MFLLKEQKYEKNAKLKKGGATIGCGRFAEERLFPQVAG